GKSIPSEYPRASAFATRLRSLVFKPRLRFWLGWIIAILVLCLAIFIEAQTSLLQSWIFTSTNERLFYSLEDGPSRAIAFPRAGPFDERRGYSKLPAFQARLTAQNYRVTRQARQSETMLMLEEHGVSPPPVGISVRQDRRYSAAARQNPAVSGKPRPGSSGNALAKPGDRMGPHAESGAFLHRRQASPARARARRQHPGRAARKIPPLA